MLLSASAAFLMLPSFSQCVPYPSREEDSTLQLLQPMNGLTYGVLASAVPVDRARVRGSAQAAVSAARRVVLVVRVTGSTSGIGEREFQDLRPDIAMPWTMWR